MVHKAQIMAMGLFALLVLSGCAATRQATVEEAAPLCVEYEIQYVDYSSIGVDLMVFSPVLPSRLDEVEQKLYETVTAVAADFPKGQILSRQGEFRDALNPAFRAIPEYGDDSRVVLLGLHPRTWVAQR